MRPELSIEFFPPQSTEGVVRLDAERDKLAVLKPDFFSVTFGAGGSTQERTFSIAQKIISEGFNAAPHLSCIGSSKADIHAILQEFQRHGVRRIVALRGDLPSGMVYPGELRHASDLVAFIREKTGDSFHISVAAYPEWHPQARSPLADLKHFALKINAGANDAITQYFYNADAYFHFVDAAAALGVNVPIIPGVMPILSFSKLARFSDACGAEIPRWMRCKLESYGDDAASIRAFGLDIVTALCGKLLENNAPGLHFYSMNQSALTLEVCKRLNLPAENTKAA